MFTQIQMRYLRRLQQVTKKLDANYFREIIKDIAGMPKRRRRKKHYSKYDRPLPRK